MPFTYKYDNAYLLCTTHSSSISSVRKCEFLSKFVLNIIFYLAKYQGKKNLVEHDACPQVTLESFYFYTYLIIITK